MSLAQDKILGFLKELQPGTPVVLDGDGMCTMEFKEGLLVTLAVPEEGPYFSLQAGLIEAPVDASLPLLAEALRMNLRFADTGGGSIGLYDAEELLVFRFLHPVDYCDGPLFANILANFVDKAYHLNRRLQAIVHTMLRERFGDEVLAEGAEEMHLRA